MQYSPARRTALVLCGSGAHGAYHAGVLRALQEAGVKIDVVAGQGIGAGAAVLAAIDGGARLWEPGGIWRSAQANPASGSFYGWRRSIRIAGWLTLLLALALLTPLILLAAGLNVSAAAFLRIALGLVASIIVVLAGGVWIPWTRRASVARRAEVGWWWGAVGAPLDGEPVRRAFARTIWQMIRGAAREVHPSGGVTGRRYAEVLAENLGQPGFRELMIVATDLDARSDVIAAMLSEPYRHDFIAPRPGLERRAEVLDLGGSAAITRST